MNMFHRAMVFFLFASALPLVACENTGGISAKEAKGHVAFLMKAAKQDVSEVRKGMPAGAKDLAELFSEASPEVPSAEAAREALGRVRSGNNDLDSAKSTFFLIASRDGTILRNNLEEDEMAGKNLFDVYPSAGKARKDDYFEFRGSWSIARGVNGRDDAQWCAVAPVLHKGNVAGYFVSGWSWSSYAYRLEMALRSEVLTSTKTGEKVPLLYVYLLVGPNTYGAPVSPLVNGKALQKLNPLEHLKKEQVWITPIEIERRQFGVAFERITELGDDVVLAVLRSET